MKLTFWEFVMCGKLMTAIRLIIGLIGVLTRVFPEFFRRISGVLPRRHKGVKTTKTKQK